MMLKPLVPGITLDALAPDGVMYWHGDAFSDSTARAGCCVLSASCGASCQVPCAALASTAPGTARSTKHFRHRTQHKARGTHTKHQAQAPHMA